MMRLEKRFILRLVYFRNSMAFTGVPCLPERLIMIVYLQEDTVWNTHFEVDSMLYKGLHWLLFSHSSVGWDLINYLISKECISNIHWSALQFHLNETKFDYGI